MSNGRYLGPVGGNRLVPNATRQSQRPQRALQRPQAPQPQAQLPPQGMGGDPGYAGGVGAVTGADLRRALEGAWRGEVGVGSLSQCGRCLGRRRGGHRIRTEVD